MWRIDFSSSKKKEFLVLVPFDAAACVPLTYVFKKAAFWQVALCLLSMGINWYVKRGQRASERRRKKIKDKGRGMSKPAIFWVPAWWPRVKKAGFKETVPVFKWNCYWVMNYFITQNKYPNNHTAEVYILCLQQHKGSHLENLSNFLL